MLTTQNFLQRKVFGNFLPATKPLEYRKADWQELNKGRERSVRLIIKSTLGVPSAHLGEQEHAMWCFQFPKGSLLVVYIHRGTVTEVATRADDAEEIQEAVDFLITEVTTKVRQL